MTRIETYKAGVNLGHWLSQSGGMDFSEYRERYITRSDLERIAGWGMDHVRLPVDYHLFERDDEPGVYNETGLAYIDCCLNWCRRDCKANQLKIDL